MSLQVSTNSYLLFDRPIWWLSSYAEGVLDWILDSMKYKFCKTTYNDNGKLLLYYGNMPMGFDIEDTSFYDGDNQKVSVMYVWQFAINGYVFMGRRWEDFIDLIDHIKKRLADDSEDGIENRVIIFVHFLDHEFQFMRKRFKWDTVFSRKTRSPIYAVTDGIEFRDSYILTGKSLAGVAGDLQESNLRKMVGDLDYTKMRGTQTPITKKEIGYCMADVQILNEYIREKIIEEGGNIGKIPLTKTGYVRRYVRRQCLPTQKKRKYDNLNYFKMIHSMNITGLEEYQMLERAFAGGFTHANALYIGETLEGKIDSIDFTSSYPAQILAQQYPMSTGQKVNITSKHDFEVYMTNNLCIFTIMFIGLRTKPEVYDGILSRSKCSDCDGIVLNNGRIMKAKKCTTTITNVDFESLKRFYDWDNFYIGAFYIYKKDYLPKPIIESVLKVYGDKTSLKGVEGQEVNYMLSKNLLNSIYGMMVTNPVKELVPFDCTTGEWLDFDPDEDITMIDQTQEEKLQEYNENKQRFLFYPWGVFVTAYARQALYSGILAFGKDYVYSDTDSIKCLNLDKHMDYVQKYDRWIIDRIDRTLDNYGIDRALSRPKNIKGSEKQIGIWDIETSGNPYTRFKTLGAKRYIYEQSGELHITIAGVSKKMGRDYIKNQNDAFDFFKDGMEIDKENSGKLTHTYIDDEVSGVMQDYRGVMMPYDELSCVHLEKSGYVMSMIEEFKDFIKNVQKETIYI